MTFIIIIIVITNCMKGQTYLNDLDSAAGSQKLVSCKTGLRLNDLAQEVLHQLLYLVLYSLQQQEYSMIQNHIMFRKSSPPREALLCQDCPCAGTRCYKHR